MEAIPLDGGHPTMLTTALWLLAIQRAIGAFDTVYFHEWRACDPYAALGLPGGGWPWPPAAFEPADGCSGRQTASEPAD
jgi:hypothetical protein